MWDIAKNIYRIKKFSHKRVVSKSNEIKDIGFVKKYKQNEVIFKHFLLSVI